MIENSVRGQKVEKVETISDKTREQINLDSLKETLDGITGKKEETRIDTININDLINLSTDTLKSIYEKINELDPQDQIKFNELYDSLSNACKYKAQTEKEKKNQQEIIIEISSKIEAFASRISRGPKM